MAVDQASNKVPSTRQWVRMSEQARDYARMVLANPRVVAWDATEHSEPLSPEEEKEGRAVMRILRAGLRRIAETHDLPGL